jgi:hypothetical protein
MDEIDIWRAADNMVKLHGNRAELAAADRAEALLAQGSVDGYFVWKRIVDVIQGLAKQKPDPGEMLI